MVQVPTLTPVTVLPLTPDAVQTDGVVEVNVTARPELAVALAVVVTPIANVVGENVTGPIVWSPLFTETRVVTGRAAA